MAQATAPVPPKMTLLYSMQALLGERFSLGPVPYGQERIVIPIVGGSFEGPRMNGTSQTNSLSQLTNPFKHQHSRPPTPQFQSHTT
jgi:hypothetical protein